MEFSRQEYWSGEESEDSDSKRGLWEKNWERNLENDS